MTHPGPLTGIPIACRLAPEAGQAQVQKWQTLDADYALGIDRTDTRLIIHYAKVDDSVTRLRELVVGEKICCSFAG